jgi:hypothetical protein
MNRFLVTVLSIFGFVSMVHAQSDSPFRSEKVVGAFEQMRSTPGFDTTKPLQWGFFFISSSREPLLKISKQLQSEGYQYVEEHQDKNGKFWLQLAKIEIHTPESLHRRNGELFNFAKGFSGVVYDGWDVTRQAK